MKNLKITLVAIFFYLFNFFNVFSQCDVWKRDLIHNAGFEDIHFPCNPNIIKAYEYLEVWECDANIDDCKENETGNDATLYLHSPDWFNINSNPLKEFVISASANYYIDILPNSGNSFVGMGSWEIVQQRFFNTNPISTGQYVLTFNIRLLKRTDQGFAGNSNYNNVYVKVFLAKNKIEYSLHHCVWCDNCLCEDEDYKIHVDGVLQDIDEVLNIPLNLVDYPTGNWHVVINSFNVSQSNYDYIGFELIDNECNAYVLIDDISLMPSCTNGCSSTAGTKSVCASSFINETTPFYLYGLKNLTNVKLIIYTGNANELTVLNVDYPQEVIAWNGEVNGTPIANANYHYRVEATNDCGTETFLEQSDKYIIKIDDYDNSISQNLMYFNYNPVDKPPIPGCELFINISNHSTIQDKSLAQPLLYKAIEAVIAGPDVLIPENNEVVFEAGNTITLLPGFTAQAGTDFTAKIDNAAGNKNMKSNNNDNKVNNQVSENSIALINSTNNQDTNQNNNVHSTLLHISPNPFTSVTKIKFDISYNSYVKAKITDMFGVTVKELLNKDLEIGSHSFEWNASENSPGVYFCTVETSKEKITKKIILTR